MQGLAISFSLVPPAILFFLFKHFTSFIGIAYSCYFLISLPPSPFIFLGYSILLFNRTRFFSLSRVFFIEFLCFVYLQDAYLATMAVCLGIS